MCGASRVCGVLSPYFFFQAEDGIRDLVRSRGLGDVYKRQHQYGHGDLLQVFGEVGLREGDDAVVMRLGAAHHTLSLIHI